MLCPTEKQTNVRAVSPKATLPAASAKITSVELAVTPESCHSHVQSSHIFGKRVLCLGTLSDFLILSGAGRVSSPAAGGEVSGLSCCLLARRKYQPLN